MGSRVTEMQIQTDYPLSIFKIQEVKVDGFLLPLFGSLIPAGFPSPADDYIEDFINLNEYVIRKPTSTYLVKVGGDSLIGLHILPGDVLVVDKAVKPMDGSVVVGLVDGEFTIKQLSIEGERVSLVAANDKYPPIEITPEMDFRVWGVKVGLIRR